MATDLSQLVPPEIGVHILNQLSPLESRQVLSKLQHPRPWDHRNSVAEFSQVVGWLYARLYANFSVVYIDNDVGCGQTNMPQDCDMAATPTEMISLGRDKMFLANIPRRLEFRLTRDMREHSHFQKSLCAFVEMISAAWAPQYFGAIGEISLELNGDSAREASPTSMSVAVLNVLANLTRLAHCNFRTLTIQNTLIGEMFPHKWEGVFKHFPSVERLSLRDNAISSASANRDSNKPAMNMKWPANLKSLCLADNSISSVSSAYLRELPASLEKLDLSNNQLTSFGLGDGRDNSPFFLAQALPNLKELDLSGNTFLNLLDASIFLGPRHLGSGLRLRINLRGCKIIPQCMTDLKEIARASRFVLLI